MKEMVDKAAENLPRKEERDLQNALKTSQTGKRKGSKLLPKPKKKQKRSDSRTVTAVGGVAKRAPPLRPTKSGRTKTLPAKFR